MILFSGIALTFSCHLECSVRLYNKLHVIKVIQWPPR